MLPLSHASSGHAANVFPAARPLFGQRPCRKRARGDNLAVCAIKARWCIDIKYGVKMEAITLVQDWIQSVGSLAGLQQANTNLLSGAVGAAESRLELEVEFETLALLEQFWAAIPPVEHKAWSQQARNFIIDGSPRWEIYRTCPIFAAEQNSKADPVSATLPSKADPVSATLKAWESASAAKAEKDATSSSILEEYLKGAGREKASDSSPLETPLLGLNPDGTPDSSGRRIALDWKGDPMIINPGDNMPLF